MVSLWVEAAVVALLLGDAIVSAGSSDSSSLRAEAWVVGLKLPPPPKGPELPGNLDSAIVQAGLEGRRFVEYMAMRLDVVGLQLKGKWGFFESLFKV